MSQLDAPFSHACGIISLIEGGRSFNSWVWGDSNFVALDELIADLMALPASLISVGDESGVMLQDVFCKLPVGHQ